MWTGTYIVDGQKHGRLGHDCNFALNMTVPLLIESVFTVPECVLNLDPSLEEPLFLPKEESAYLQEIRTTPRSLEVMCRDTLRRYHTEQMIHRLVDNASMPQIIKDFILLKPLLQLVPNHRVV